MSRATTSRLTVEFRWSLVLCAVVGLLPLAVGNEYWLGVLVVSMYFALLAAAWNLLAGYTGQFSLAPAAFAMIGAYTTGLLAYHWRVPPALGIPAAVVVAGGIGLGLGRIVMRLKGPYLALTTLSFAEIEAQLHNGIGSFDPVLMNTAALLLFIGAIVALYRAAIRTCRTT